MANTQSAYGVVRLYIVQIGTQPLPKSFGGRIDAAQIAPIREITRDGEAIGHLVAGFAACPAASTPLSASWAYVEECAKRIDENVASMVHLHALDTWSTFQIRTPGEPYLGIVGMAGALDLLDSCEIEWVPHAVWSGRPSHSLGLIANRMADHLADRLDGVRLIAEALNAVSQIGQFVHLIRFFERAFAVHAGLRSDMSALVKQFLSASAAGFSHSEIDSWFAARGPAAHADRRENFHSEIDVLPLNGRIFEASLDVLFNKTSWRSADSDRREVWTAPSGMSGTDGDIYVRQGQDLSVTFQLTDSLSGYPLVPINLPDEILLNAAWISGDIGGARLTVKGEIAPAQSWQRILDPEAPNSACGGA